MKLEEQFVKSNNVKVAERESCAAIEHSGLFSDELCPWPQLSSLQVPPDSWQPGLSMGSL